MEDDNALIFGEIIDLQCIALGYYFVLATIYQAHHSGWRQQIKQLIDKHMHHVDNYGDKK